MTAKKRPAPRPVPPMPLSELPMMKALLALTGTTTRPPSTKRHSKTLLTMLRLTIIDKLQVLALRRPQALVIIAQVLDSLLDEQLNVLDGAQPDSSRTTKTRSEAGRIGQHRSDGR
jgi:hypothetical protein